MLSFHKQPPLSMNLSSQSTGGGLYQTGFDKENELCSRLIDKNINNETGWLTLVPCHMWPGLVDY